MIEGIRLRDVTIFDDFEWEGLSNVNLVIGENDTGKSNLLKMLYAVTRSLEETSRSTGPLSEDVQLPVALAEKLQWTYLPRDLKLGEIVRKGGERLRVGCRYEGKTQVEFGFSSSATKEIHDIQAEGLSDFNGASEAVDSLFIPPEEILTTRNSIVGVRERLGYGEFDDTYYDLARALMAPESHAERDPSIQEAFKGLDDMFPGRFEQTEGGKILYRRGNEKYSVAQAAQGIKKIGMLTQLIRSRHIRRGSVLFFDEPSTNLNPKNIISLVDLLFKLSQAGVQLFVATHSYVVLKQFELLAREHEQSTPLCVLSKESGTVKSKPADLSDRIPRNSIVDASVDLFNRDVGLELK